MFVVEKTMLIVPATSGSSGLGFWASSLFWPTTTQLWFAVRTAKTRYCELLHSSKIVQSTGTADPNRKLISNIEQITWQ